MSENQDVIITTSLRRAIDKSKARRAKKSLNIVKEKVRRMLKSEKIILDPLISEYIYKRGIKNSPSKIYLRAKKFGEFYYVSLLIPSSEEVKSQ